MQLKYNIKLKVFIVTSLHCFKVLNFKKKTIWRFFWVHIKGQMQEGTVNLFFVYYAESYPHSGGGVSGYPPPWRFLETL